MAASDALVRATATALSLQLLLAAGAVAGPWAVTSSAAATPVPAAVQVPTAATSERVVRPVSLSAPGLWEGAAPLSPLGVSGDGRLDVPPTALDLGWWADGPAPGAAGAAVVVGHVDLDGRPGRFARLASAGPGTVVTVRTSEAVVQYRVVSVEQHAKERFPTDRVYRPVDGPELRLITCGGRFDPRTGHYEDNVVVRAVRADG